MAKKLPDLVRRHRALDRTRARFAGRAFELGVSDCVILARAHLKAMGHAKLPAPGRYRTAREAMDALAAACAKVNAKGTGIEPLLDALLTRIPPAAMLPGDVALAARAARGDTALGLAAGALVVSVGRKFWGWHPESALFVLMEPLVDAPFRAAWRA